MEPDPPDEHPLDVTEFHPSAPELYDQQGRYIPTQIEFQKKKRKRFRLAIILFVVTCFSVFIAGMIPGGFALVVLLDSANWTIITTQNQWAEFLTNGCIYGGSLMLILFAHEMGHYLQAKRYGVPASFPFFIPFPISPFGTMGAVIVQGAGVADRKSMFDIAISGPLAGLVFALPIAWYGMTLSSIAPIPQVAGSMQYGNPLILQWMSYLIHGPLPEGYDFTLNPFLFAGWVGIFITALNLIPIGQLDGGHILYTLIGKKAHYVAMGLMGTIVALMFISGKWNYILMVILLYFMGPKHPPTADDTVPLGKFRIFLGWLTLTFIIIGFTPTPITETKDSQQKKQQQQEQQQERILQQQVY